MRVCAPVSPSLQEEARDQPNESMALVPVEQPAGPEKDGPLPKWAQEEDAAQRAAKPRPAPAAPAAAEASSQVVTMLYDAGKERSEVKATLQSVATKVDAPSKGKGNLHAWQCRAVR